MRVFLSYRRSDVGGHAGRLSDELVRQLGPRDVFHDVSTIAPGEHFPAAIERALADSEVVLAVIGPTWLTSATADGTPRLLQPGDYVRMELGRALALGRTVTPVLVGGASLPSEGDLPEELRPLALRQAVTLHDESWHEDVGGLLRRLRGQPAGPARRTRRPAVAAAVAAAVVIALAAVGGVAWWPGTGGTDGGDAVATLPPCTAPAADAWTALSLAGGAAGEISVENGMLEFRVREGWWRARDAGTWEVTLRTRMDNRTDDVHYHGDWLYGALIVGRTTVEKACFSPEPEIVSRDTAGDALVGFRVACRPLTYIQLMLGSDEDRVDVTSGDTGPSDC